MKKFILFCFLFLTSLSTYSQNRNVARHLEEDATSNMVSINSKSFYVERTMFDSLNLVAINDSGRTLFKRRLNMNVNGYMYSFNHPQNMITTRDKHLFVFGKLENSCDVLSNTNFIAKVDTNGQLLFNLPYTVITNAGDMFLCATEHPDSSFYLIGDTGPKIYHYSKTGAYTGSLSTVAGFSSMSSLLALQNGNLLVNGVTNSGRQNMILSIPSGSIIYQQATTCTISAFQESPSGVVYGLDKAGAIYTFSNNLQALNNSVNTTAANMKLRDFKIRNDSVFCAGYLAPTNNPYYAVLNSSLNLLYQSQSSYKNIFPTGISINNKNKISIITRGTSNSNFRLSFSGLYQTSITGSLTSRYDIGVISYTPLSSSVSVNMWSYGTSYLLQTNLSVQVKNFTNDTVRHFYLNHMTGFCLGGLHSKYTETIAPYATITVTTGVFQSEFKVPANNQSVPFPVQLCVSTSIPNFENDIEIDNDSWCGPLMVLTGINESSMGQYGSLLFPNPTRSSFNITSGTTITRVEIYGASGSLIFEREPGNQQVEIITENWSPGIYFVKIISNQGFEIKKMIKD